MTACFNKYEYQNEAEEGDEKSTYLVKSSVLSDIFDDHIRKLAFRSVGMGLENLVALVFGSDRYHRFKASVGIEVSNQT